MRKKRIGNIFQSYWRPIGKWQLRQMLVVHYFTIHLDQIQLIQEIYDVDHVRRIFVTGYNNKLKERKVFSILCCVRMKEHFTKMDTFIDIIFLIMLSKIPTVPTVKIGELLTSGMESLKIVSSICIFFKKVLLKIDISNFCGKV